MILNHFSNFSMNFIHEMEEEKKTFEMEFVFS